MKIKGIICLCVAGLIALATGSPAFAESYRSTEDWQVEFTKGKKMVDNYTAQDIANVFRQAQPGDDVQITVSQINSYKEATNWYMSNKTIRTLEKGCVANGGAYEYKLTYTDPDGKTTVLYDSKSIGGDDKNYPGGEGLHEATDSLDKFFYMDTLEPGERSHVTLSTKLEGDTQGNYYQNTMGIVKLNWATELAVKGKTPEKEKSEKNVKTGDSMNMLLIAGIAFLCGLIILIVLITGFRKKDKEGDEACEKEEE